MNDAGLANLKGLPVIHLRLGSAVSDAGLVHIAGLDSLERLGLSKTNITDAGMIHLAGLDSLKYLALRGTTIGDNGLRRLQGLDSLKELYLAKTNVTDSGLDYLKKLNRLSLLDLRSTHITAEGLTAIKKTLRCRILDGPYPEAQKVPYENKPAVQVEEKEAGKLEFRILADSVGSSGDPISSSDLAKYKEDLKRNGPVNGKDHIWLPILKGYKPSQSISTNYKGQTYILVSNKPGKTMLADGSWGLEKSRFIGDYKQYPGIELYFDMPATELIKMLSWMHIGSQMAVIVDGKVISVKKIFCELSSIWIFSGGFDIARGNEIVKMINKGMPEKKDKENPALKGNSPRADVEALLNKIRKAQMPTENMIVEWQHENLNPEIAFLGRSLESLPPSRILKTHRAIFAGSKSRIEERELIFQSKKDTEPSKTRDITSVFDGTMQRHLDHRGKGYTEKTRGPLHPFAGVVPETSERNIQRFLTSLLAYPSFLGSPTLFEKYDLKIIDSKNKGLVILQASSKEYPTIYRLSVDPDKNYNIVKITTEGRSNEINCTVEKQANGLWYQTGHQQARYDRKTGKSYLASKVKITKLDFNPKIPADIFQLEFPKDTKVWDGEFGKWITAEDANVDKYKGADTLKSRSAETPAVQVEGEQESNKLNTINNDMIFEAIELEDTARIQQYLASGADINVRKDYYNGPPLELKAATPLFLAIAIGNTEIIDLLIANGANVNAKAQGDAVLVQRELDKSTSLLRDLPCLWQGGLFRHLGSDG